MHSRMQMTAAGVFLALVACFIFYLTTAPDYEPPPAPAKPAAPKPQPEPPPPLPEPVVPRARPAAAPLSAPQPPSPKPEPPPADESFAYYGSIEGVVTRVTVPIPRVKITVAPDAASGDPTNLATVSDPRGRFRLPKVPIGRVVLHVTDPKLSGELRHEVMVRKDETAKVDIKLPGETATMEGVISAGGAALPATVEITTHGEGMTQTKIIGATDGHYFADNLLPGVIDIMVATERPPGERKVKTETLALQPGEFLRKDFSFSAPSMVSGRIGGFSRDENVMVIALFGELQPNETITSPDDALDRLASLAKPDGNGNFRIPGLDPGAYTIIAFSAPVDDQTPGHPPVFQSQPLVIDLAEGTAIEDLEIEIKK